MTLPKAQTEGIAPGAYAPLPAVNRPGVHATPDGTREVSGAAFADAVLDAIPLDALLFRRGNVVGVLTGTAGSRRFDELDGDRARLLIDRHVRIVTSTQAKGNGGGIVVRYEPTSKDLAGLVLAAARTSSAVPELQSVVAFPTFLPGWTLARPGFNEAGIFYDEPPHLHAIAGTQADPRELLEVLDDVIDGFPYKDEASREAALAFMVTLAVRPAIEGNVPGFLVRAHAEGTGKTLLTETMVAAVTAQAMEAMQFGTTEAEREKRITSEMLKGKPLLIIDNLPNGEEIDSPGLAMLLTAPRWMGRVLGKSSTPSLPNGTTVLMTGNNTLATREIARRIVPIHIEATTATPQARTDYVHEDPVAYARANQGRVLGAVIGLVEYWKASGRPPFKGVPFGGFASWTQSVGGILTMGGSTRFLAHLPAWQYAADPFTADATALLGDWYRRGMAREGRGMSDPLRARELVERAGALDVFATHRQGATQAAIGSTFGKRVLAVLVDRIFAVPTGDDPEAARIEVRVRKHTSGANTLYALEVVS